MRLSLLAFGLCVVLGVASCPQQVPNLMDCTNDDTICTQQGLVCDTRLHECVIVDGCITNAMCSSPSASVCSGNLCAACSVDDDCVDWSMVHHATPQRNFCTSLSQQNTCTECRPAMKGADCADPLNPACDASLGLCRPCRSDDECDSGLCRKLGDYPVVSPVAGLLIGQCVPLDQVSYVDQDADNCSDTISDSAPDTAFCTLDAAIKITKPYVHVAASKNLYDPLTIDQAGRTIIIVGPHPDGRSYAYSQQVMVKNGTVILQNLYFLPLSDTGSSVACIGSGSSVYVVGSTFYNAQKMAMRFVDASQDCGQITVDRTIANCLNSNKAAVFIGGTGSVTTSYHITNSSFLICGGSGDPAAVQLNAMATGYLGFNFYIENYRAVNCASTNQNVDNSIIIENSTDSMGCTVDPNHNILDESLIDSSTLPFLQANSPKNAANVIDKGSPPPPDHPVPFDFDGNPRPQGAGYDIGMQELR